MKNEQNEEIEDFDFLVDEYAESQYISDTANIVERQIKYSTKVLKEIQDAYPISLIVGGAPRDWKHGREARDIDIYILVYDVKSIEKTRTKLEEITLSKVDVRETTGYTSKANFIKAIYGCECYDLNFDFIICCDDNDCRVDKFGISSKEEFYRRIIESYDFGICMIAYDTTGYICDDRFTKDFDNKTLTIYFDNFKSTMSLFTSIKNHMHKIYKKFPDHTPNFECSEKKAKYYNFMLKSYDDLFEQEESNKKKTPVKKENTPDDPF